MKKVEKVSIAEISFTLDNDAYISLKQYLDSLHDHYAEDRDGAEIIADIEARIAELILDEQVYTKVVSRPLIDKIVAQLGTAEDIDDGAAEGEGFPAPAGARTAGSSFDASIPRRLHRSAEGKILGGVCSGLAGYLNISAAWVRLAFLLPLIMRVAFAPFDRYRLNDFFENWSWVFFVTYIVLWIALPMARTPRQKLEARGEKITPSSIRRDLQGSVNTPAGKKAASVAAELVNVLGRVVLFCLKFATAVIGFGFLIAVLGIFIATVVVLANPATMGATTLSGLAGMTILSPFLFVPMVLLCVMVPIFVIGMAFLSFTFGWRLGRVFFATTLGLWLAAMVLCTVVAANNGKYMRNWRIQHRSWSWDDWRDVRHDGTRLEIRRIE